MQSLVQKELSALNERLKAKKLIISLGPYLQEKLCKEGYSPTYGARPLAALFNKLLIAPLAKMLLKGEETASNLLADWDQSGKKVFFTD